MSKRSGRQVGAPPITRRQQVAALRTMKANEVAANLADKIREAVKEEVEKSLSTISATVLDCIDRVLDIEQKMPQGEETHEGDSDDRPERAEAVEVPEDDAVVREPIGEG